MTTRRAHPVSIHWLLLFVLVAAGYAVGYKLAQDWFSAEDQGASFFPPAGLTLGVLVLVARRRWPVVLAAAATTELVLDLSNGTSLAGSLGITLANVVEPLTGALLLTGLVGAVDLRRTRHLTAFIGFGVLAAPVAGAAIAAATWVVLLDGSNGGRFALEWWSGDGLGVLVVGSAIISLRTAPRLPVRRSIEAAVLALAAWLTAAAVFDFGWFELVYIPVALLVVIAFRVGTTGVALSAAGIAFVAAGAAADARGFWGALDVSPANRVLYLQLALAVVISSALALAAEIAERERMAGELARTESEKDAALVRARAYEGERAARRQADVRAALLSHLNETVGRLSAAATEAGVAEVLAAESSRALAGARSMVLLARSDGELELAATSAHSGSNRSDGDDDDLKQAQDAFRTNAPIWIDLADQSTSDGTQGVHERRAFLPLPGDDRPLGVLAIGLGTAAPLAAHERDMLLTLARQGALALRRAGSFEREQEARRRLELLERHASKLAAASAVEEVAETTISELAAIGASAAWVHVLRDDELEMVAETGVPPENVARYARYPLAETTPPAEAARTALLVEVSTAEDLDRRYPAAAIGRSRLQAESLVSAPLRSAGGRVIGVLSLASTEAYWLGPARRRLVVGLAEQCGLALERALLKVEADQAAADAALLAKLGDVLERVTGSRERCDVLAQTIAGELHAGAAVHDLGRTGTARLVALAGIDDAKLPGRTLTRIARTALASGEARLEVDDLRLLAMTLRARDRVLGVLTLVTPRRNRRVTRILLQRIATRAALAIDNALIYEQERTVSHSLQMSLLGPDPISVDRAEVATAYLPGSAALEVGGDWFDVFDLPNGRRAFVVGDVVGHGLEAAIAMGQLRGAVRALAPLGSPTELLEHLDVFVDSLPEASMATLAYAELDPDSGRLRHTSAGHPPAIVVSAEGRSRFLWDGRSAPLGSSALVARTHAEDALAEDETLVLYTDGLVERRTVGLDAMLERLLDTTSELAAASPQQLVAGVLESLLGDDAPDDDVCLLALRRSSVEVFATSFPAAPIEIRRLRHGLDDWLAQRDVDTETRADLVLAVSEAAANAAEHAYGYDGSSLVHVEVRADDTTIVASVADQGLWRGPSRNAYRGRGTQIMKALMNEVSIRNDSRGTTVSMRRTIGSGRPHD